MLFGVGVYGFVFGNITNILLKRNPARTQFLNNLEKLRSFVNFHKIPSVLQKRIRNYYKYIWRQKLGYNGIEFIAGLPMGLKTDVEIYLKRNILERVPLFKGIVFLEKYLCIYDRLFILRVIISLNKMTGEMKCIF